MLKELFQQKYSVLSKCNNCSAIQTLRIPKGITIKEFMEINNVPCSYCGCYKLIVQRALTNSNTNTNSNNYKGGKN